jgi:hypothetical protein
MNKIQSLPGRLLRITMAVKNTVHSVRIVPDASIVSVQAMDTRLHIHYINRQSDILEFHTIGERDRAVAIVETHLSEGQSDVPSITNYPYPEPS